MNNDIHCRPARRDDLAAAARVYVRADDELDLRMYGRSRRQPAAAGASEEQAALDDLILLHAGGPDRVWLALRVDDVIGMAGAAIRERHWHLVYLFVVPEAQGRGVGRALLERIYAVGIDAGCDIFTLQPSVDPKALSRYLKLGLTPRSPSIDFRTANPRFPPLQWDDGLNAQPLTADDAAALATAGDIDRVVRGVRRPEDLRRWLAEGAIGALVTRRDSEAPAGYYLVAPGRIGPVAAMDGERFAAVLARGLTEASGLDQPGMTWRIDVPGENRAALLPLFAAGFRPRRLSNIFANAPIGRWDRYILHDEDLL